MPSLAEYVTLADSVMRSRKFCNSRMSTIASSGGLPVSSGLILNRRDSKTSRIAPISWTLATRQTPRATKFDRTSLSTAVNDSPDVIVIAVHLNVIVSESTDKHLRYGTTHASSVKA